MVWSRTSDRWAAKPGAWDRLNLSRRFASDNKYGIPNLIAPSKEQLPEPPTALIPYNLKVTAEDGYADAAMSFFIDDYRFEYVWTHPLQTLPRIQRAHTVVTPDFSLYTDYPLAAQIWNTYRSRWCGAFWQANGLVVIPSIAWSTPASYQFCFDGVEYGSPVAISTQGLKWDGDTYDRFRHGFDKMMTVINPRFVLSYGKVDEDIRKTYQGVNIKAYPTYWDCRKKATRLGLEREFYQGDTSVHNGEF